MILNRNRMFAAAAVSMSLFAVGLATSPAIASADTAGSEWQSKTDLTASKSLRVSEQGKDTFIYPTCYVSNGDGRFSASFPREKSLAILKDLGYDDIYEEDTNDRVVITTSDSASEVGMKFYGSMQC